ncbi:MAG: LysM peptidoglycan-binding domain-containing protein [Phycisphaerae bacterium]|jgi:nucleoid-associated protein YgaU|nr:LysM peptidoglycan-binding domain-containing protein [Phycisphaerae bacterium]
MRTDVKIGIVAGLVIITGVVAYMVLRPGSTTPPDEQPGAGGLHTKTGGEGKSDPEKSIDDSLFGPRPADPWAPGVGGGTTADATGGTDTTGSDTTTGDTTTGDTTTGVIGVGDTTTGDTTAVTDTEPGSVEITMVPAGPVDPGPADTSWPPAGGDSSAGPVDPGTPRDAPYPGSTDTTIGGTGAAVVGTTRTHVIRSNDKLWTLAETYYGHGKHWQHLVAANPGLSPTALVVGKTIKVPPLPVQDAPPGRTSVGPTGTVTLAADGTKTYIVAKNDSFWKIAARSDVYGNGIHYKLIAAANPSANSNSLQPGDKLIIPPLTATSPGGDIGTSDVSSVPDPVTATGEKIYVVKNGDNGMWGVSKSQYGDGKYYSAIAGRNPGVNPSRLRIGQKLILPSLEQAKTFIGGSSRSAPGTSGDVTGTSSGGTSVPIPTRTPRPVPAPAPVGGDGEPDFS